MHVFSSIVNYTSSIFVRGSGFTKRVTKSPSIQNSHVATFAKSFTMLVR